jgi:predicted anti-sigma-YlaC factor YlaD
VILAATLIIALPLCGCSVRRWAVDQAGDALSGTSVVAARDDDPELIRAAAPFNLKLIESLLDKSPDHSGLLLAAASGFTQYSYAFVQLDADIAEDQDLASAARLHRRALRMYVRARDYGLRDLEVRHPGFRRALQRDATDAVAVLQVADVATLYWTATAWSAAVSQAKDDPGLIGDLGRIDALVARAEALNADFGAGALQSFLISYEMARAGRADVARAHFERAVALSHGTSAGPHVALAESVCVGLRARAEFLHELDLALAIDPDRHPDDRLENLVMQRRAQWLRGRVDDLFLPDVGAAQPEIKP